MHPHPALVQDWPLPDRQISEANRVPHRHPSENRKDRRGRVWVQSKVCISARRLGSVRGAAKPRRHAFSIWPGMSLGPPALFATSCVARDHPGALNMLAAGALARVQHVALFVVCLNPALACQAARETSLSTRDATADRESSSRSGHPKDRRVPPSGSDGGQSRLPHHQQAPAAHCASRVAHAYSIHQDCGVGFGSC